MIFSCHTVSQIEACLNSHPFTSLPSDIYNIQVLTPEHFLIGRPLETLCDSPHSYQPVSTLPCFELCWSMVRHFWQRWSSEYMTTLQKLWKSHIPPMTGQLEIVWWYERMGWFLLDGLWQESQWHTLAASMQYKCSLWRLVLVHTCTTVLYTRLFSGLLDKAVMVCIDSILLTVSLEIFSVVNNSQLKESSKIKSSYT